MSKALKPIIITGVIILIAAIALVLLIFVFPETGASEASETPSPSASSKTVKLVDEDDTMLISFEARPKDGESMLVEISRDADGNLSYEVTPAAQYFTYDTSKFRSMIYTLTSLSATNLVEQEAQDLAQYGLDDPSFVMRCKYSDGRVIDICIGKATPTDSNYYANIGGTNDVYTVGSYVCGLLMRPEIEYRNITLFPLYEDDAIYENIDYVRMVQRDGTEIELSLEDLDNLTEGNITGSAYFMSLPITGSCNDTTVKSYVLDVVATLTNSGLLTDIAEDEYADYGFDNPAELEMHDILGNSVDILIGDKYEKYYYYVMLKESPGTVIICPEEAFTWLNLNYIDLMNRIMWYTNIVDVSSIEYDMDGEKYLVEMTHGTRVNANGDEVAAIDATINDEPLSETNCRRLFVRTLNFRIIGEVMEDENIPAKPKYSFVLNLLDGSKKTVEFFEINDRQYAVAVNGEVDYYVYKKNVATLEDAFETIMSGGELKMSYDA